MYRIPVNLQARAGAKTISAKTQKELLVKIDELYKEKEDINIMMEYHKIEILNLKMSAVNKICEDQPVDEEYFKNVEKAFQKIDK